MSGDRAALSGKRTALHAFVMRWARKARRFERWITLVGVIGGSLLLGIGSAMSGDLVPATGGLTNKGLVIALGALLALIGNALLLAMREEAAELLERATDLDTVAQGFLDERDGLLARLHALSMLDRKRLALIDANRQMRETLEQALLITADDAAATAQLMLTTALSFLTASIGFESDEEWAISVFQVQGSDEDAVLRRIACARADRLGERRMAREWRRHEGFVGEAWARERDMIIEDSSDPKVAEAYPVPDDLKRPYDAARYRSMAAIPVRVGDPAVIWGVIAASTNQPHRFRRAPEDREAQAVDTVRLIARMTALMAAAFARPVAPTIAVAPPATGLFSHLRGLLPGSGQ